MGSPWFESSAVSAGVCSEQGLLQMGAHPAPAQLSDYDPPFLQRKGGDRANPSGVLGEMDTEAAVGQGTGAHRALPVLVAVPGGNRSPVCLSIWFFKRTWKSILCVRSLDC